MIDLKQGDCLELIKALPQGNYCIVTDPPFNVGYHYKGYKDNLPSDVYLQMLKEVLTSITDKFVVIHYPEQICDIAIAVAQSPERIVLWVYNSNTKKQHRDIAFWGVTPDFSKVLQPYKNPTDKRIKERIAKGIKGCAIYDWWNINQVKNVSKKAINHPCVMPLEVMTNIIGLLPSDLTIVDPFLGSGTTGVACKKLGRDFIGMEINPEYYAIAQKRIAEYSEQMEMF